MEPQTTFFENVAGRLQTDPRGFLRLTWHPNVADTAARRELMEQALAGLVRYGHGRILVDQRFMAPFSPAEQQWISEDWTPRALQQGQYRRRAVLTARDAGARRAAATILMSAREQISYCYFDEEAEAVAWLLA